MWVLTSLVVGKIIRGGNRIISVYPWLIVYEHWKALWGKNILLKHLLELTKLALKRVYMLDNNINYILWSHLTT
jgi:hypothetical protein